MSAKEEVQRAVSLEAANKEIEYVFIGKIKNLDDLKKAFKVERQEQWEIKTLRNSRLKGFGGGTIRVRSYDDKRFELTFKHYLNDAKSTILQAEEKDIEIDHATFNMIKALCPMGSIKARHHFHVPNSPLIWEYDVYSDAHGKFLQWCKIDLEVPSINTVLPDFPIPTVEVITRDRTPQQEAFVRDLFVKDFSIYKEESILPVDNG